MQDGRRMVAMRNAHRCAQCDAKFLMLQKGFLKLAPWLLRRQLCYFHHNGMVKVNERFTPGCIGYVTS